MIVRHALFLQGSERPAPRLVDLADGNHHAILHIEGDFPQGKDRRADTAQLLFNGRCIQRSLLCRFRMKLRLRLCRKAVPITQGDGKGLT